MAHHRIQRLGADCQRLRGRVTLLFLAGRVHGCIPAFLHFVLSGWLWRDYVYGGADFDSEHTYAPSGMAKSFYMLVSFIALLGLSLTVTIIDIEQGCLSSLQQELGVCSE